MRATFRVLKLTPVSVTAFTEEFSSGLNMCSCFLIPVSISTGRLAVIKVLRGVGYTCIGTHALRKHVGIFI